LVPFALLIFFGPDLFQLVLGRQWGEAGAMASALSIMFAMRFTISPLTYMYYIAGKQREDFVIHLLMLVAGFLSFYCAQQYYPGDSIRALWIYGGAYALIYIFYFFRSYQFCYKPR
jgi:O-antigen/teichoic acid export membrane protein